ncbi:unnamed protein product [Brachionus calyciflorus]|uniref:Uncharacterized protein n=1 Tax=Brachionus calyciflorus TaxID=104777 RepID=A0A813M3S1_9BILA|nr:unnamed protein product [Brachionus calyciflorus]
MWYHFETEGYPRTNKNLEGYNNILSNHLSVAHPDIYKAISKFQEEESDASLKYYRAIKNVKAPPRKKLNVINDSILINHGNDENTLRFATIFFSKEEINRSTSIRSATKLY